MGALCVRLSLFVLPDIQQLEILAQSRKLQSTVIKIQKTMPFIYDIKKDLRYIEGKEEGRREGIEEGKREVLKQAKLQAIKEGRRETLCTYIENTLSELRPLEEIARIFEISIDLVRECHKKVLEKQSE